MPDDNGRGFIYRTDPPHWIELAERAVTALESIAQSIRDAEEVTPEPELLDPLDDDV